MGRVDGTSRQFAYQVLSMELLESRSMFAVLMAINDGSAVEASSVTQFIDAFVPSGQGGLDGARDVIFHDGKLYVASALTDSVLRYDAQSGDFDSEIVPSGSGGLDWPESMVFDSDGNFYVSSTFSHEILRYSSAGGFLGGFVAAGSGGLTSPKGIAFGPDGRLYVASFHSLEIYRYQGPGGASPGSFIDVYASGFSNGPAQIGFGPDGRLYVTSANLIYRATGIPGAAAEVYVSPGSGGLASARYLAFDSEGNLLVVDAPNNAVRRYQGPAGANPAAFIDTVISPGIGGLINPIGITQGPDHSLYVSSHDNNHVLRYGAASQAAFTVTLSSISDSPITVNYSTADGSAQAGSDYVATSGTLTFAPGQTKHTIFVQTVDDAAIETNETFSVVLWNPDGAVITDDTGVAPITDNDTKFYVVNDGDAVSADRTYEYGAGSGDAGEAYTLASGNAAPRGAVTTATGDKVWVVDANKKVYVYDTSGSLLGSWTAGSLHATAQVEGITTNGTDIWLVDAKQDRVYRYAGAAARLAGSQSAASSFALNSGNRDPKDIVTDGVHLWVVNNSTTDKVFKYTLSGSLVGSWTISSGGGSPTGITIDPSNVSDVWIVDNATDRVYQFTAAASRTSGSQSPAASFALAAGNTNPQGIADPPAPSIETAAGTSVRTGTLAIPHSTASRYMESLAGAKPPALRWIDAVAADQLLSDPQSAWTRKSRLKLFV
jgi:hypothetical protein